MDLSHELPFPASSDYFRIFRSNNHQILFRETTLSNTTRVNNALNQLQKQINDLNELELFALFVSTREIMLNQSSVRRHHALKSFATLSRTFLLPHVVPYVLILAHDADPNVRSDANIVFSQVTKGVGGLRKCLDFVLPALGSIGSLCMTLTRENRFNFEYSLRSMVPAVIQSSIDIVHIFQENLTRPMLKLLFGYLPSTLHSLSDFLEHGQFEETPVTVSILFTERVRNCLYALLKELSYVPHSPRIPQGSLYREQSPQCVILVSELLSNESLSFNILRENTELLKVCLPRLCAKVSLSEISEMIDSEIPDDAAAIAVQFLCENRLYEVLNPQVLKKRPNLVSFLDNAVIQYITALSSSDDEDTSSKEPSSDIHGEQAASQGQVKLEANPEENSLLVTKYIMETTDNIPDAAFETCRVTDDLLELLCRDFSLLTQAVGVNESIGRDAILYSLKSGEEMKTGSIFGKVYSQKPYSMTSIKVSYQFLKGFFNEVNFCEAPIELAIQFLNHHIENTYHSIEILIYENVTFSEDTISAKLRTESSEKLKAFVYECYKYKQYNILLFLSFSSIFDVDFDYYNALVHRDISVLNTTEISDCKRKLLGGEQIQKYQKSNDLFELHLQAKYCSENIFVYDDLKDIVRDLGLFHDVHDQTIKYIEIYLLSIIERDEDEIIGYFMELSDLIIPSSAAYLAKGFINMFNQLLVKKPSIKWIEFGSALQNAPTAIFFGFFSAIAANMDELDLDMFCTVSRKFPSAAFQWSQMKTRETGFTFSEQMRSLSTEMKNDLYKTAKSIVIVDVLASISDNTIEFVYESPNDTFKVAVVISPDYPFGSLTFQLSSLGKEKSTRDCKNEMVKEFIRTGNILKSVSTWHARTMNMSTTFDTCPVCLSLLDSAGYLPKVRCSKCGKGVHTECITQWRKKSLRKDCPTCRAPWKKMKRSNSLN